MQLQSLQLAKVEKNLFRSNKYLGPNATKTWDFLLNRDREIEMPDHDLTEGIESELQGYESNDPQNEIQRDIENDLLPQVNLPEQPTSGHHNTAGGIAPGQMTDVYGQTDTEIQREPSLGRRTRSGRSYRVSETHKPSIIKDPTHHFIPWPFKNKPPTFTQHQAYQRALSHAEVHGLQTIDVHAQKAIKEP